MKEQQKSLKNLRATSSEACSAGQTYEPPTIEVVEITLEKGFAGSGSTQDFEYEAW